MSATNHRDASGASRSQNPLSRRQLLTGLALAPAAGTLIACGGTTTTPNPDMTQSDKADATPLNALLTAEYTAIAAYSAGATVLGNPPAGDPLMALAPTLLQVAIHFQSQHKNHAAALATAVAAVGGTPVAQSSVTFTLPSSFTATVTNVLKLACNAEKGAAIAYNGAVAAMQAANNRFLAASIEGDETQHFIILYALLKATAQPGAMLSTTTAASLAPESFVSLVGSVAGLEAVADFDVTM